MERLFTYIIHENESPLRVEQYLRRKGYSRQNLTELKKMNRSILLNGVPCRLNEVAASGNTLTVHIKETISSPNIVPVDLPLDIIYEDKDVIVINKAAGMPIHPSTNNYKNSMANGLVSHFEKQGLPFVFRCTNRLDRDTSGLTIVAKHMVSSSILSSMAVKHEVVREYLAIVRGNVAPASGTISAPLSRKPGSIIERTVDFENGETAVTHYHVLETKNGHSLVSLQLETGRTHQIRIHLKHLGFPLIGDYLYNPDMEHIQRQALHSHKLSLCHPITGEHLTFIAPLPEDMSQVLTMPDHSMVPS